LLSGNSRGQVICLFSIHFSLFGNIEHCSACTGINLAAAKPAILFIFKNMGMKSVKKIITAASGIVVLALLAASCKKETSGADDIPAGKSKLTVFLTDDPSLIFDSIFIDIQVLEAKIELPGGAERWDTLPIRTGVYNILKFRNGVDTLLSTAYVPNGEIKKLRLTLGSRNSVMKNGSSFPLFLHNNNRQVIIDIPDIDRIDPNNFRIWIDFDGHGSIIKLNNNQFELRPRIHTFNNSKGGRLEGEVKPGAALPAIIKVIAGADTLLAVTDNHDGDFKVRGIKTSLVKVIVIPSNGYKDSIINNVAIRPGDKTDLDDIVLHR
jgi:hypothetical protein